MTERVLVDTGAIYAFVVRGDANHVHARRFVKSWLARKGVFVLGDVVFAETMTLLKARIGGDVAIRVGRELRENAAYAWVALGPDGERDTWSVFQRFDDKEWSYTDCALLVLGRRLDVPRVFSFDRHIAKMPELERVTRR